MASIRYFLIDPGFEDFDSHHGSVAETLIGDASSTRKTVTVLASKKLSDSVKNLKGKIIPFFTTPCYTNNLEPLPAFKENELAEKFQAELSDLFRRYNINQNDVIVLHTAFSHLFLGLAKFLSCIPKLHIPKLIVCGMFDPGIASPKFMDEAMRYSWFIKNKLSLSFLERSLPSEKLVFATSCNEYKIGYEALTGASFLIHPAINYQPSQPFSREIKGRKRLLLFVGSVKEDKGTSFILNNSEHLCKSFPNVDFILHWNTNSPGSIEYKHAESLLRRLGSRVNNFDVLFGTLTTEQYELLFDSVQGVIASYMPNKYKYKTSGVFWDVLRRSHCNLLCSKGTWLERESNFMEERAYFFDYGDIDSMIRAIKEWEIDESSVDLKSTQYKNAICRSFSEWLLSRF